MIERSFDVQVRPVHQVGEPRSAVRSPLLRTGHAVRRIAHISDVHLLEAGPVASIVQDLAIRLVSVGRAVDARARTHKLERSLQAAIRAHADHVVISGDLTEVGTPAQFDAFASVLEASDIPAENVTLVPGNHDAYTAGDAWRRALDGPLRAYRGNAADTDGKIVDRGDVMFLPVDVSCVQPITRSAGELRSASVDALERRFADPSLARRALVVVQHHHPFEHARTAWQWLDGLRGSAWLMGALSRYGHVQVLHGHLHKAVDRLVGLGRSRVLGAPATVDDDARPRVRLYDLRDGQLEAVGLA